MWLLEQKVFNEIQALLNAGITFTAEQQVEFEAQRKRRRKEKSKGTLAAEETGIYAASNGVAEVSIEGMLTQRPSIMSFLFGGGGTTYADIQTAVVAADADPQVAEIELLIDSPGGTVDGLFETLDTLDAIEKPMKAIVNGQATSAAYAIAATANEIIATNRANQFGSVGVAAQFTVDDEVVTITSTNAPAKRPDASTDEGREMIVAELDAVHALFVDTIAQGRDTTTKKVNVQFGQGATLLAEEALKRGMIDTIESPRLSVVPSASSSNTAHSGGNQSEVRSMDLITLQTQHPALYAQVVQSGVDQERDRVTAHLTMGKAVGALDVACTAIEGGEGMTATLSAKYMTAGLNRKDTDNFNADGTENAGAADGADTSASQQQGTKAQQEAQQVLSILQGKMGVPTS